jgi:hypothetical protein
VVRHGAGRDRCRRSASSILARERADERAADSAPQQTVLNGWVATDQFELISSQQDHRPAAMLALVVLGLAPDLTTSRRPFN